MTVAALYVDPRGPYPKLIGEAMCWTVARDARMYHGPWPVIAHPPCAPWGSLRSLCHRHDEETLGLHAALAVRRYGGVLEQPAGSRLWEEARLPRPHGLTDRDGSFSVQVDQVAWGHVARKRTWLYFVGVDKELVLRTLRIGGEPTHWCSGVHTRGARGETPPGIKVCSAEQRRRTPVAFAEWLVMLVSSSSNSRVAGSAQPQPTT